MIIRGTDAAGDEDESLEIRRLCRELERRYRGGYVDAFEGVVVAAVVHARPAVYECMDGVVGRYASPKHLS